MRRLLMLFATVSVLAVAVADTIPDVRAMLRDVFPVSRLKPGMKGYGLTVFKGTKIERFEVEVVGVLENANFGRPLVMIMMKGGPITERNAMVIGGMSGSPIFIEGKILGALAYGFAFPREPVALVTPLEDMLTNLHQKAAAQLADVRQSRVINQPVEIAGKRYAGVYIGHEQPSVPNLAWARPLMTPLMVSGLSSRAMKLLKERLEPHGLTPVMAPSGGTAKQLPIRFEPGAAVGAPLATGDIDLTAIGTLTYRNGDYVLAFGHPFLGLGAIEVPMTAAEIVDVFASYRSSFKLGNRAQTLGAVYYDGAFAIAGRMGKQARMLPIRMRITNSETGIQREFRCEVMRHPQFVDLLVLIAGLEFMDRVHFGVGDTTATVRWRLDTRPFGEIRFENRVTTRDFIADAAMSDLLGVLLLLQGASETKVELESLEMEVIIQPGRGTALIESLQLDKSVYRPGERIEATVRLRPANGAPAQTYTLSMRLPADAMPGRYIFQVSAPSGGAFGGLGFPFALIFGEGGGGPSTPDTAQRLREFLRRERNNQLIATLNLPFPTVSVEGTPLEQAPPLIRSVMTGQRLSRAQFATDRIKQVIDTPYVLEGVQTVMVTVLPPEGVRGFFPMYGASADTEEVIQYPAGEPSEVPQPYGAEYRVEGAPMPDEMPMPPMPGGEPPAKRERPVSRAAQTWQPSDFGTLRRGTLEGVALRMDGTLHLAVAPIAEQRAPMEFIWSVAPDAEGALLVGGGFNGRILRFASEPTPLAALAPDAFVTALARADDGTLYAGLSPTGTIVRLHGDKADTLLRLNARYVNAMRWHNGTLYIATGVPAQVLAWNGTELRTLLTTDETHFSALTVDAQGMVYAGTSERGIVYQITPAGVATPIADLREASVMALAVDSQGNLYIAGAPSGNCYRWTPSGELKPLLPRGRQNWRALLLHQQTLYAVAENEVYQIDLANSNAQPMLIFRQESLQLVGGGIAGETIQLASADGRVLKLAVRTEGVYLSPVLDAGTPARWGTIRWSATLPPDTAVEVHTRSGNTREPDATWSAWTTAYPDPEGSLILSPPAQYLQVRLVLKGKNGASPTVHQISVSYMPANRPPEVQLVGVQPYAAFSGKQTLRWRGRDPDGDTLRYEVQLSSDGGQTWQPLKNGKRSPSNSSGTPTLPADAAERIRAALSKQMPLDETVPPQGHEQLMQMMQAMPQGALSTMPRPVAEGAETTPAEGETPSTPPTQQQWDTAQTPDGVYLLRVMATDQPASPTDYAVVYSPAIPVVVCNTPPALLVSERNVRVNPDGVAEITGFALQYLAEAGQGGAPAQEAKDSEAAAPKRRAPRHSIAISGVQYKVGNGEWRSAEPLDGLFDSAFEAFRIRTDALPAGEHTITIKVFNAAGVSAETQQKVKVERAEAAK